MKRPYVLVAAVLVFLPSLASVPLAQEQPAQGQARSAYGAIVAQIVRARVPLINTYADSQAACPAKRVWAYPLATVEVPTCSASCAFRINPEGRARIAGCRGDTREHTAILREAVAGALFPPPPGGGFFGRQTVRFHGKGRNPTFP